MSLPSPASLQEPCLKPRLRPSKLSTFHLVQKASSIRRHVNAAPSYPPAFTFVIRDNIAFATPSTACAYSSSSDVHQCDAIQRAARGVTDGDELGRKASAISQWSEGTGSLVTNEPSSDLRPAFGDMAGPAEHSELICVVTGHVHAPAASMKNFALLTSIAAVTVGLALGPAYAQHRARVNGSHGNGIHRPHYPGSALHAEPFYPGFGFHPGPFHPDTGFDPGPFHPGSGFHPGPFP